MLDDLTAAATAHGLQLHPKKNKIISNTTSKRERGNTVAVQGMKIEILPPQGKIKYHCGGNDYRGDAAQIYFSNK